MVTLPDNANPEDIFIPSSDVVKGESYRISLKRVEGLSLYASSYAATKTTEAIALSTIEVPEGRSVKVGDFIIANETYSYLFRVTAVSSTTVTVTYKTSLRGAKGDKGDDGSLGSADLDDAIYSYGVYHDNRISAPECTRVGNMELHRTLPIHSRMRGCLLNNDGEVVKYFDDNWTAEVRDGSQGQVMVEIPEHYRKFNYDGGKLEVRLSEKPLEGYHKVPLMYVSAYEAAIDRRGNGKLASVVNKTADYRGGTNISDWDGTYRSLLGTPATNTSITNFRKLARNRKNGSTQWNCYTYEAHKAIYWLFVVEYATLNSQADYTPELTAEGYRQGGLGAGVTNLNSPKWNTFNTYNPFIPCGYTDSLGNKTGIVAYNMPNEYDEAGITTYVTRYRGIENPFGHIYKLTDGIIIDKLNVNVCNDPAFFNSNSLDGYKYVGKTNNAFDGYVKKILGGEKGEIISIGISNGSSTTYFCDYQYIANSALRAVAVGGYASSGASAGFVCAVANHAASTAYASIGSRLCFHP